MKISGQGKCEADSVARVVAFRTGSSSVHDEKVVGTLTTYDASYLVIRSCVYGSTFVGAYRDATDAVVVKATRHGRENAQGAIMPTEADKFSIIKNVSVEAITTQLN